jgi:lysylphosphatidylglycerol synthetase-like protein (DUF2156 family)
MFSLRTMFVVVAIAALAVAAIASDSSWIASLFVGLTVVLLLWAIVETRRPFWRAFYVFGIGYMAIAVLPSLSRIADMLPSTLVLDKILYAPPTGATQPVPYRNPFDDVPTHKEYAGHCATALLLAFCAGTLYQWRTDTERQVKKDTDRTMRQ